MFMNYTPHALRIRIPDGSGQWLELSKGTSIPRVEFPEGTTLITGGVSVTRYGSEGKPVGHEEMMADISESGGIAITSMAVAQAMAHPQVFSPGDLIRDEEGKPIGCDGLKSWYK